MSTKTNAAAGIGAGFDPTGISQIMNAGVNVSNTLFGTGGNSSSTTDQKTNVTGTEELERLLEQIVSSTGYSGTTDNQYINQSSEQEQTQDTERTSETEQIQNALRELLTTSEAQDTKTTESKLVNEQAIQELVGTLQQASQSLTPEATQEQTQYVMNSAMKQILSKYMPQLNQQVSNSGVYNSTIARQLNENLAVDAAQAATVAGAQQQNESAAALANIVNSAVAGAGLQKGTTSTGTSTQTDASTDKSSTETATTENTVEALTMALAEAMRQNTSGTSQTKTRDTATTNESSSQTATAESDTNSRSINKTSSSTDGLLDGLVDEMGVGLALGIIPQVIAHNADEIGDAIREGGETGKENVDDFVDSVGDVGRDVFAFKI